MTPNATRRPLTHKFIKPLIFICLLSTSANVSICNAASDWNESPPTKKIVYADMADLVTSSPIIAKIKLSKVRRIEAPSPNAPSQLQEMHLIEATVDSLIRGQGGLSPTIRFLLLPPASGWDKNSRPKKKQEAIIYARAGSKPGEVQLVSRNAYQIWSPDIEARTRAITTELLKADSPPSIVAVGDAFHIAGTIAGEGETQIFLKTDTGAPVSLSIIRRPGQRPNWGVSLGEVVDESAVPPARETLLWYRLACGLPQRLPPESTRSLPILDTEAARKDYAFVLESLGRCDRTL